MGENVKKYIGTLMDMVWDNPGITSYGLMDKLIKSGYEYQSRGELSFDSLIRRLKFNNSIRYDDGADRFYAYRSINYPIVLEAQGRRTSCYDCLFCVDASNMVGYTIPDGEEELFICSLNPLLNISRQVGQINSKCPVNCMLDEQESNRKIPTSLKALIINIMAIENTRTVPIKQLNYKLKHINKKLNEMGVDYDIPESVDPYAIERMASQDDFVFEFICSGDTVDGSTLQLNPVLDPAKLVNSYKIDAELAIILSTIL